MSADVLQYGALGLLFAVLVGVGWYLRDKAKCDAERETAEMQRRHAREDAQQAFLQSLVNEGTEAYKQHAAATQAMNSRFAEVVEADTKAKQATERALYALAQALEQQGKQSGKEHKDIKELLEARGAM